MVYMRIAGFFLAAAILAVSAPPPAQAVEESMQRIRLAEACGKEMTLSAAGCQCLTDRAIAELNDVQRDYLLATSVAPSAAERMRDQVSQADIQILGKFLAAAAQECSGE
jgi:hypothetical protein